MNGDNYNLTAVANTFYTNGIDHTESEVSTFGDRDAHRNNSFALNYQHQLGDAVKLGLSYNRNETESEYDGSCTDSMTYASVECYMYSKGLVDSLSGMVELKVNDLWHTSLQLGQTNDESEELADNVDLSTTFSGGEFNTTKKEVTWVNNLYFTEDHMLTAGLDYQLDTVDGSTDYDESSRDNKAAFAQFQSDFGAINTNFGIRSDDNEQFGEHTTASALVGFDLADNVRLVASYGEGFKAPTFNDLYYPNYGDPTFEPEESKNYEFGLNANIDTTFFTIAVFKNEVTNLIQYNPAIFASDQIAKADITGVEWSVDTQMAGWLLGLSGSMIDPENSTNGKLLRRRAERLINVDADYDFGNASIGFSVRAESERYDDVDNEDKLSGYALFGVRAAYHINDEWAPESQSG